MSMTGVADAIASGVVPAHGDNQAKDREEAWRRIGRYGADAAKGDDSLTNVFIELLRGSNDGLFNLDKNRWGKGIDDAAKAYGIYQENHSRKPAHTHTYNGAKSNKSKMRVPIKVGQITWCDPVAIYNKLDDIRTAMLNAGEEITGSFVSYLAVGHYLLSDECNQVEPDEDTLRSLMRRQAKAPPEAFDIIKRAAKAVTDLVTGENKNGLKVTAPDIQDGASLLNKWIAEQEADAHAAELERELDDMGEATVATWAAKHGLTLAKA